MIKDTGLIQSKDFKVGLYTRSDIINPDTNLSPNCMDIQWFFDNSLGKRLGSSTTNTIVMSSGGTSGWTIDSSGSLSVSIRTYWKLDEASGTRIDSFDATNFTDVNGVLSIVGIRNQAALFSGVSSQGLYRATTASIESGNVNFSVAGWIYLTSTSATVESTIISKRDPIADVSTVLLCHMDGPNNSTTFTDVSTYGKTVTSNSGAQVDTSQFKYNGASLRCKTGGNLVIADNVDFNFGSGDFTIEGYMMFATTLGNALIAQYQDTNSNRGWLFDFTANSMRFVYTIDGTNATQNIISGTWAYSLNTFYHVAVTRSSNTIRFFANGSLLATDTNIGTDTIFDSTLNVRVGAYGGDNDALNEKHDGWIDDLRVSKGISRYNSAFTSLQYAFSPNEYEYWLYVNTDGIATFRVSSDGITQSATVRATSQGVLALNTWYNVLAWHSNNSHIGISVNLSVTTSLYTGGLRVGSAPFMMAAISNGVGVGSSPTMYLTGRMDEWGFWGKVLNANDRSNLYGGGTGNTFTPGNDSSPWYSFDFGASGSRWLTVCVGSGIVASSNLGATFVTIATTRTLNYQYLDRSKNVLIATSDSYDVPLYWAGSASTFMQPLALNSAPKAKFSVNYQGFCILINSQDSNGVTSNRRFSYADENLQLTDPWNNGFDLPSSADDEATGPFILNKFLYVSTKFRIFRLNYTGGNPDWSYIQVANFGFVPRTMKVFSVKGQQVAIGLDWSRRMRIFYGYQDDIISDNVENDNDYCEFAMQKISLFGSGLIVSNAEFDQNLQEYRLNLAIGAMSTQTTHAIVFNARTLAMYPYYNQPFNTTCMAESGGKQFLMGFDRSGRCHILNSGNLDAGVTPINEIYDSPLLFQKSPAEVTKNKQINFFFSHDSCGTLYYQERFDFSRIYSPMRPLRNYAGDAELKGTESTLQLIRTVDLPSVQNVYQFRVTSSAGTADPWKLTHFDLLNTPHGFGRGG